MHDLGNDELERKKRVHIALDNAAASLVTGSQQLIASKFQKGDVDAIKDDAGINAYKDIVQQAVDQHKKQHIFRDIRDA